MSETPERIWACENQMARSLPFYALLHRTGSQDTEYVRADIHEAVKGDRDGYKVAFEEFDKALNRIKELEAQLEKATGALREIARPRVGPDVDWTENEVNSWRAGRYREYGNIARAALKKLKENKT
jgi:hypothetical protein